VALACLALGAAGIVPGTGAGAAPSPPAPGLSRATHAALVRAGAFGRHPIRVLLLGDSIALTLGIGLSEQSPSRYGITIANHAALGCDLDPDSTVITEGQVGPATLGCLHWRALWPFLTAGVHPQVVVLGVGRWEVSDHFFGGHWVHVGERVWDDHLVGDLDHAISIFKLFGAKVVLLTMPLIDPSAHKADGQPYPEDTPARTDAFNRVVQSVARSHPGLVTVIPLDRLLAPAGVYTSTVDGVVARWADGIHVTVAGGEVLRPEIMPTLDRLGLQADVVAP